MPRATTRTARSTASGSMSGRSGTAPTCFTSARCPEPARSPFAPRTGLPGWPRSTAGRRIARGSAASWTAASGPPRGRSRGGRRAIYSRATHDPDHPDVRRLRAHHAARDRRGEAQRDCAHDDPRQPRLVAGARRDAPSSRAGPGGAGRRVVDGAVSLPHRQRRPSLRRPARVSAAELHGARPLRAPGRTDQVGGGSGRQAHRDVQLHREWLDLVPAFSSLHRAGSVGDRVVDRRHRHPLVRADGPEAAAGCARAREGPLAVGDADRRRAGGHLQSAAARGLPSTDGTDHPPVPRLSPGRARVLSEDGRVPPAAPDRTSARSVGGEPVDRAAPHRGVQRRQRLLHRGAAGIPVRDAVARGRARGHDGRDGRGLPSLWARAQPVTDRGVRRRGVSPGIHEPPGDDRGILRGLPRGGLTMPIILGTGAYRYQVVDAWAKLPPGREFNADVAAVGVDKQDRIYAFNRGQHPMVVLDRDGNFLSSWGEGLFRRAHGVHMAPDDTLWLTDDGDHTVRHCTLDGKVLLTLGIPGAPRPYMSGEPFHRCTHTALSPEGDLYVSDGYGNSRVHKYAPNGTLLRSWGEPGTDPGQFNIPHNICCDADGWVYVADRENHRVQVFDGNGRYETQWNNMHRPSGLFMERGSSPRFYVGEIGGGMGVNYDMPNIGPRVSIYSAKGEMLARLGQRPAGLEPGQFMSPQGLAVDSRGV